jgi:dTDP-4-amino-4,6-dideoxygalactose transaminase
VLTDDDEAAEVIRSLRVHGCGQDKYDNVRVGINGRLDTLQAAILLEKLTVFHDEIEARNRVATRYDELLPATLKRPRVIDGALSVWAQYTVRTPARDECVECLKREGVMAAVYYARPLHRQPAYLGYPTAPAHLLTSEQLAAAVLSLPMHPYLMDKDQVRIAAGFGNST